MFWNKDHPLNSPELWKDNKRKGRSKMKAHYTIIIGPPRCGKTLNSEEIAKAYGCSKVLDGCQIRRIDRGEILVLSNDHPRDPFDRRKKVSGRLLDLEVVKRKLGNKWVQPHE